MSEETSTGGISNKNTFFSHVFSTTEEGKAEIMNVVQYSLMGVVPVVFLNKLIQRFIPEADPDKSTLELLAEILIQIIIMFCGIILIHRIITFVPTYSEFKYESLSLTNVILAFLVLVLSIQTKLGIKVNILFDRLMDLWNGTDSSSRSESGSKSRSRNVSRHQPSQGDYMDSRQPDMFPPAPMATAPVRQNAAPVQSIAPPQQSEFYAPVMAANSVLGGSFGSAF